MGYSRADMHRAIALASLVVTVAVGCAAPVARDPFGFHKLAWSREIDLREEWLAARHASLLELMRRHGVAMWIVVNEEFHDDPLTAWVAPARPYVGGRDFFVFIDGGAAGLRKVAVTGFWEESVSRFFDSPLEPKKQKEALAELYAQVQPKTIALSIDGNRGVTRSLTRDGYKFLVDALGPEAEKRFVPAEPLIVDYLDTRLPGELEPYRRMVELTDAIVREAFSSAVIHPGKTTVGEVRRWLYDALGRAAVTTWFQPDMRVQRQGMARETSRGFLAVAKEDVVIQRGDVIHVDFGVTYLGLNTDFQRMGYVLPEGHSEPPAGLKAALANTNAVQDALAAASRPGRISADVYDEVMAAMKARGIEAMIYSHPLGAQGHGLGAAIDLRAAQRKDPPRPLRAGSWLAMELNSGTPVPEWGGQKVFVMEEDPVYLTDAGWKFFVPRQTEFLLVR
jgi:Xaa-Pro aminopeptidase